MEFMFGAPKRTFRKTESAVVADAWAKLWDPEVRKVLARSRRMKWGALEGALTGTPRQRKKIARAVQNLFVCWSAAHPGVPIWPLLAGTPEDEAEELLDEFEACPPPTPRTTRFLWKDKHPAPESLGRWGRLGADVWAAELVEAEARAIEKLQSSFK